MRYVNSLIILNVQVKNFKFSATYRQYSLRIIANIEHLLYYKHSSKYFVNSNLFNPHKKTRRGSLLLFPLVDGQIEALLIFISS